MPHSHSPLVASTLTSTASSSIDSAFTSHLTDGGQGLQGVTAYTWTRLLGSSSAPQAHTAALPTGLLPDRIS